MIRSIIVCGYRFINLQGEGNISSGPTWDGVRRLVNQQFRSFRENLVHGIEFGATDNRYRSHGYIDVDEF